MAGDSAYFHHCLFIALFALVAIVFSIMPIVIARFIAPKKPSAVKQASYECGLEAEGDPWIRFHVQYYLYALFFVIFDVETAFIYPWAVAFKQLGLFAFIEMIIFIAILFFGLAYAWRKGLLEWE